GLGARRRWDLAGAADVEVRRPGRDGEAGPGLLAVGQGRRAHRGLGVPVRLADLHQGQDRRRYHAVRQLLTDPFEPMMESRLIVTKRTPPASHGLVAAEHPIAAR